MKDDRRPSPEAMLARVAVEQQRRDRGHLKIFFGASPGVGKTYAMLEAARARRREGVDVVLGWVETHGRAETAALIQDLERIPHRVAVHRDVSLQEFDLDAALRRHPGLLLVDELAHTNAPGVRHARRWQDIEELLQAGIDVYTTLNVQHIESLNDVVAQITGVTVRERVPDSIVDAADEIELVDLPPDELLQRLREGKVYVPAQAQRAMESFFRKGNLIALRELALRRAAERVDAQVAEYKREHGIAEPWPTRERILVAVGSSPQSAHLVRRGFRMAARLRAPWIALSVETPASARVGAQDHERVAAHLALAERLGAQTLVVRGENVVDEVLAAARQHDVTRIIVGKPRHARWRDRLRGSLVDDLVRGSAGIDVLVTVGEDEAPAQRLGVERPRRAPLREYFSAALAVATASALCFATRAIFTLADQSMIYVLAILVVSGRLSRGPALLAALLSVGALDFFFVPPYTTFAVSDFRYVVTFCVMLVVGLIVSSLTFRIRSQAEAASQRERRTASSFAMSRDLAVQTQLDALGAVAARHLRTVLDVDVVILLAGTAEGAPLQTLTQTGPPLSDQELAVARWVHEHGPPAGHGTDTLPGTQFLFLPLVGTRRTLGTIGLAVGRAPAPPSPAQRQLLDTFVAQIAVALERAQLAQEAEQARLAIETERTRSTLLAVVSHDLRTPLASITGAASVLLEPQAKVDAAQRGELLRTIREEGDRLSRLVGDLLELTRLQSASIELRREWCPLEEIVSSALGRMRDPLRAHRVDIDLPSEVLLVPVDPVLLEEVLINLLENAVKYAGSGTPIAIRARSTPGEVAMEVEDRGPGFPEGTEEQIFEKFYRGQDGGRTVGTGLGLAICRAIIHAHGGEIRARNREGGGAVMSFTLPLTGSPPVLDATPSAEGDGQEDLT